jgi:TolB-like protein/Tfp pilus assembly protein PilF
MSDAIPVFISYSHDSDAHRERVLALSEKLRADGIDTRLDQYVNGSPPEGWPRWMMDRIDEATFVLVVCTETYYRRFRGHEVPGAGRGSDFEGGIITQQIYDTRSNTTKFIPVLFDRADERFVPEPLRGWNCYTLTSDDQYQALYDVLLGQAGVQATPVGPLRRRLRKMGTPLAFGSGGGATPDAGGGRRRRRLALPAGAAVLALTGAGLAFALDRPAERSVAVLPLENLSLGGEFAYLADGLTEDIITRLASVEGMQVPSRRAVMRYRGTSEGIPDIADELDVAHVLGGSVRRTGERLHISVYLRDRRDRQIWDKIYEGDFKDVFEVQADIARQIADALKTKLSPAERTQLASVPTERAGAYDLYLKGREHLYRQAGRQVSNDSAIALFQQALRLDAGFGLAYAGLARAYEERSHRMEMEAWYDSAVAAGRKAVEQAPREERAHAALGYVLRAGGRHREALGVLRNAAELPPSGNDASGRSNLGLVFQELGRPDSAVHWHRLAAEMEPTSPTARIRVGVAYEALGNAESAAREYERALGVDSTAAEPRFRLASLRWLQGDAAAGERWMAPLRSGQGHYFRFLWEVQNGRWPGALNAWNQWRAGDGRGIRFVPPVLALAYMGVHDTVQAQVALARAEAFQLEEIARRHEGHQPRLHLAEVHALRGDVPAANRWFAEAVRLGYLDALAASRAPALAALRGTPQFEGQLRTMRETAARLRQEVKPE